MQKRFRAAVIPGEYSGWPSVVPAESTLGRCLAQHGWSLLAATAGTARTACNSRQAIVQAAQCSTRMLSLRCRSEEPSCEESLPLCSSVP